MDASGLLQWGQYAPPPSHMLCIPSSQMNSTKCISSRRTWGMDGCSICKQLKWTLFAHCLRQNCEFACVRIVNASLPANMQHHWTKYWILQSGFICNAESASLSLQYSKSNCQLHKKSLLASLQYVCQYLKIYVTIVNLLFPILFSVHELHFWGAIQHQERLLWTLQQTSVSALVSLHYHQSQHNNTLTTINQITFR